jgi:hypothetical protein
MYTEILAMKTHDLQSDEATRSACRDSNHLPQAYLKALARTASPLCSAVTTRSKINDAQPKSDHGLLSNFVDESH